MKKALILLLILVVVVVVVVGLGRGLLKLPAVQDEVLVRGTAAVAERVCETQATWQINRRANRLFTIDPTVKIA